MQQKATPSEVSEPRQEQTMSLEGGFYQRDRSWHPAALTPQYKTSVLRSPQYPLLALDNTISEMTGPRFGHNKIGPLDNDLIRNFAKTGDAIGQRIIVYGRVLDENARPVPGALVEFWQANAGGRYRHKKETYLAAIDPNFGGCGRAITDEDGRYWFRTIKPGAYPVAERRQRLAPGAYPLLALRPCLRPAPDHPDVFRGRSDDLAMPDRLDDCGQGGDRPAHRRARPQRHAAHGRARLQVRHRAARAPLDHVREPDGGELMFQTLTTLKESPSQTAGPYIHIGATPNWVEITGVWDEDLGLVLVDPETKGERILVKGRIFDGSGHPIKDALVEIWQADADGLYNSPEEKRGKADPHFVGWGRQPTDGTTGEYRFETIKPGRVPYKDGRPMAPHITFWIVARGINIGLHTRLYFGDEEAANAECPVLARIEHKVRLATLIAARSEENGMPTYTFDIHLQGDKETVFFDI